MMAFHDVVNLYFRNRESRDEILGLYSKHVVSATPEELSEILKVAVRYTDPEATAIVLGAGVRPEHELLMNLANKDTMSYRAGKGDIYKVAIQLLDAGANPQKRDERGNTCYHDAARMGNGELVRALADKGVKLTLSDDRDRTGLHLVSEYCFNNLKKVEQREKALKEAKERGMDEKRISSCEKDLENAKYDLEDYFVAAKAFLDAGVDVDQLDAMREKAHTLAVRAGAKKIAALLAGEYSEDDPDAERKIAAGGMTLHQAVIKNDAEAIRTIIDMGVGPDEVCDGEVYKGLTPLGIACSLKHLDSVKTLLEKGADPNHKDSSGVMPLVHVLFHTDFVFRQSPRTSGDIVKVMVEKGMNINGIVDEGGNNILTLSCMPRTTLDTYVIEESIRQKIGLDHTNSTGQTALMLISTVAQKEAEDIQMALLESGADALKKDNDGNTALMYACNNSNQRLARNMAEMLFDIGGATAEDTNNDGKTALDYAVSRNNESLVKLILSKMG